ncbi:Circadian clock protein KaiB [Acaryochloris thomasi RCC1774]|uniref:Circadian clock protein KaiB n=1 Tax=Acaryochloris thomasi RCC1774 TaxID=1764569 RepID=A0A2W1JVC4_9CYAN|nr:circadian clock KaiB family protein [Acaryochloris thomasi]PZD74412.1 Circadian clock protein KaiB [Acaryochloris thomasi RCC1774]
MSKILLTLYITGRTPKGERAIANLSQICDSQFPDQYQIKIIDVLEQPYLAEQEKILVTPTLIKQLPPPLRRLIGDLSDQEQVLVGLNVHPQ